MTGMFPFLKAQEKSLHFSPTATHDFAEKEKVILLIVCSGGIYFFASLQPLSK